MYILKKVLKHVKLNKTKILLSSKDNLRKNVERTVKATYSRICLYTSSHPHRHTQCMSKYQNIRIVTRFSLCKFIIFLNISPLQKPFKYNILDISCKEN